MILVHVRFIFIDFWNSLRLEAEASGYVPNSSCVLHDVDEPMKVKLLLKGAINADVNEALRLFFDMYRLGSRLVNADADVDV